VRINYALYFIGKILFIIYGVKVQNYFDSENFILHGFLLFLYLK